MDQPFLSSPSRRTSCFPLIVFIMGKIELGGIAFIIQFIFTMGILKLFCVSSRASIFNGHFTQSKKRGLT